MKKYLDKLPQGIRELIKLSADTAAKNNTRAYLVGGFVRDLLLGLPNLDLDIVVEGGGIAFAERLAAVLKADLVRHRAFGTATIFSPGHLKIDVATARKESYPRPAQLPEVFPGSLQDDLFRRDFTINAMAIEINRGSFGRLIDFFGGRADLAAGKIRVMHDLSFIDDPTRILRAVRFEKRYDFTIEPRTLKYLKQACALKMLDKVEPHRLRDELILALKEKEPIRELVRIQALAGMDFISPGLGLSKKNLGFLRLVAREAVWFGKNFPHRRKLDCWLMYLAGLLDPLDAAAAAGVCAKFAFHRGETKRILDFKKIKAASIRVLSGARSLPSKVFFLLEPMPYEVIILVKAKYRKPAVGRHIGDFFRAYNGVRLHIHGKDLEEMGARPGPRYQEILRKVLAARLDGRVATREDELLLAKKIVST